MNSYKTECPACHHDTFYVTPINGIGYCFREVCKHLEFNGQVRKKDRVRSEYIVEIREKYKDAAKYYHSSLDTNALQYLYKRGFNDKTIKDLMIGYCPHGTGPLYKDTIAKEAGLAIDKKAFLGGRITFPYFRTKDMITDIRARAIDPEEELKYKSPFGDVYYRGAMYPYNYHLRDSKIILITEAEIKADIAYQLGYAAMGLPGIGAWRQGFIQDDDQEVIIVFDNESNPDTQRNVIAAIRRISHKLIKPKIAVLPLFDGEKKAEIDTFVNKHGGKLFTHIINNALDYTTWNDLQPVF